MDELRDPQYKSADGSALRIWRDTAQNKFLSEREGRAIFDEVIYVEVISPGSRDSTPVFEVKRTFAAEMDHPLPKYGIKYADFKEFVDRFEKTEDDDTSMAGTPLSQWAEMTRTMAASLKAQNIFTVDGLANLPDSKLTVVGPDGRTWREKAKAYIEAAKNSGYATELAAALETQKVENADLKTQIAALSAKLDAMSSDAAKVKTAPGKAPVEPTPAVPSII